MGGRGRGGQGEGMVSGGVHVEGEFAASSGTHKHLPALALEAAALFLRPENRGVADRLLGGRVHGEHL